MYTGIWFAGCVLILLIGLGYVFYTTSSKRKSFDVRKGSSTNYQGPKPDSNSYF